jgi:hypothetical protein
MVATPRVKLGASTGNRKWYIDVNTAASGAAVWAPVGGVTDFKPSRDGNMEDDSDFDSGGYQSETKTAEKWSADLKVARKVTTASALAYDPGQEFLRAKSQGVFGVANSCEIRYYEMEPAGPRIEAFQGRCAVDYTDDGGGMTALSTASIKMMGQGALVAIAHPAAA